MLFGLDRVSACVNIVMGVIKLLAEKSSPSNPMDLTTLQTEFLDLYKVDLDINYLLNEKSLLFFLLKFKIFFNIFNDGLSWKTLLNDNIDLNDVEPMVKSIMLVQPSLRKVVRLASLIPLPVANIEGQEQEEEKAEESPSGPVSGTDSIAALVSMLQGFQKPAAQPAPAQPVSPPAGGESVSAQIHHLLQKKKQETPAPAASGTALNELMAALQAAKNK